MKMSASRLVAEALAAWVLKSIDVDNDFAREGLPKCETEIFLSVLSRSAPFTSQPFSVALVGFDADDSALKKSIETLGFSNIRGVTTDLHVATSWRNDRANHPRIIALATGYNPSVHGLRFFSRATSSELASYLLEWAETQPTFTATQPHRGLLAVLRGSAALRSLRSLDGVTAFLEKWGTQPEGSIDAPREALPALGLLPDPHLFEAEDLGKALEQNLQMGEHITTLSPGQLRQMRARANKYKDPETRASLTDAVTLLERYRRGASDHAFTVQQALQLVRFPADKLTAEPMPEPIEQFEPPEQEQPFQEPDLSVGAIDALLECRDEDLNSIGMALDAAWNNFDGDRLVADAQTSQGVLRMDVPIDTKILDWVAAFCTEDRFGGLIETDVADLPQALARYAEFDPAFVEPENVWSSNGQVRSVYNLLEKWDTVDSVRESCARPITETWNEFVHLRSQLLISMRPLLFSPREWLDTHPSCRTVCEAYLNVASELFGNIQKHYRSIFEISREWASATVDAILALDIVQVRIRRSNGGTSAKAVMLPVHPLHLWRYYRLGGVLRDLAKAGPLDDSDRTVLIDELKRPEQFLGVIKTGMPPDLRGLNQLLPVANSICGMATFENLHNAVSSADGMETVVRAIEHYVLLHPNHPHPLRILLVNLPEPGKILERITRLLDEKRYNADRLSKIDLTIVATSGHSDRLTSARTLEGRAQDLIYEKVVSGRLELKVSPSCSDNLAQILEQDLTGQSFHICAIFDESSIAVRRRRIERMLPMSPFCVRNDIVVDQFLGDISLNPQPGEPPFSDFVLMIQELEQEQRDGTMVASADAEKLRSTIDQLLLGERPLARWVILGDRALPSEAGMKSVRLLEAREGQRQMLLCAGDHGQLSKLMYSAFQDCNLTVTDKTLGSILRQGVNLIGAGLLDMVKKQSGQTDSSKVLGFVGMLLAARNVKRESPNALVASVDGKIARLWLKLGLRSGPERCDLLAVRKDSDGAYRITSIEVKTSQDPNLADEQERIAKAAAQIESTAAVIANAVAADGPFGAPRSEMLKEVLVRATTNRWSTEEEDANRRLTWGPWLKEIFGALPQQPTVRVDGEVIVVKLRSADQPRQYVMPDRKVPITVKIITESLAEELFGEKFISNPAAPEKRPTSGKVEKAVTARPSEGGNTGQSLGDTRRRNEPAPTSTRDAVTEGPLRPVSGQGNEYVEADWPPAVNALGMVGQHELALDLQNQARKSKGWNERFPDKLLVGPAGVGKTTLARKIAMQLLGLDPIIFNGADLRKPDMIVDRLIESGKIPASPSGSVDVAPCLIFIDEVHAISPAVATVLLSALDQRRNTTVGNVVYSFNDVVFLLATTDPGKLTEAFLSRPDRTNLPSYSLEEIAGIVWLHAKDKLGGASLSKRTCIEIAARMQCSPRPSVTVLDRLTSSFYTIAERTTGGVPAKSDVAGLMTAEAVADWFEKTLSIDYNGLTTVQMDYLNLLRNRGAASEEEIRRSLGVSNRNDFHDISEYLTRLRLIQVGAGGRSLTPDGRRYLNAPIKPDFRDRISRRSV